MLHSHLLVVSIETRESNYLLVPVHLPRFCWPTLGPEYLQFPEYTEYLRLVDDYPVLCSNAIAWSIVSDA